MTGYYFFCILSILSISSSDGVQQLLRVVADTVLEDNFDIFDVGNLLRWISLDHHQVGVLSRSHRADLLVSTQVNGAVQSGYLDGLDRSESGFDQQLNSALIAKSGKHVTSASGIGAGEQQSSSRDEGTLQPQFMLPQQRRINLWRRC